MPEEQILLQIASSAVTAVLQDKVRSVAVLGRFLPRLSSNHAHFAGLQARSGKPLAIVGQ